MPKSYNPYLVQETSVTDGTADFILGGALAGFRTLSSAVDNGTPVVYYIKHDSLNEWECGRGTFVQGVNSLSRTGTIFAGTNGANKVVFSSGPKTVSIVLDNGILNLVAAGIFDPVAEDTEAIIPLVSDDAVIAIGRRALANNIRNIAIGDDAWATNEPGGNAIAIGTGARADGSVNSIVMGTNARSSSGKDDSVSLGHKATPYIDGMVSMCSGGVLETDFTRLYVQTTNATPTQMYLDAANSSVGDYFTPIGDINAKCLALEIHLHAFNSSDLDAWYHKYNLVGRADLPANNFVQVGTTLDTVVAEGPNMTTVSVSVSIANNRLEIEVTGLAGKTIQWGATVMSSSLWYSGVPGSGV